LLADSVTNYKDLDVKVGVEYEYKIYNNLGAGYICAGIEIPLKEKRGKLIFIIEDTYYYPLLSDILQYEKDVKGDGWEVVEYVVSPSDSVDYVKSLIKAEYQKDPSNTKAVFLFGHIPVPYSGLLNPDGHPDHLGAWPADVFYADMDGLWTDTSVNYTNSSREENKNRPGDGKFDQSTIPSDVELEIGRVDFSQLFSGELDYYREYLNKVHKYRYKLTPVFEKGLVDDNFGDFGGEAFAANAYRNFPSMMPLGSIIKGDWFTDLANDYYLWAYGCGGGSYTSATGIGATSDFVDKEWHAIFLMLFGSYFGDWDSWHNFLRASLCAKDYGLTCVWAGRPNWFFHHMGLGENIGYSAKISQNNSSLYTPAGYSARKVHVALMGDPTLRAYVVAPVTGLTFSYVEPGYPVLSWNRPIEPSFLGYYVYRKNNNTGEFDRITTNVITTTIYTDYSYTSTSGTVEYMVKTIKLQISYAGSFYNSSIGVFGTFNPANYEMIMMDLTGKVEVWNNVIAFDKGENHCKIYFEVVKDGAPVSLEVFNLIGKRVAKIIDNKIYDRGKYFVDWYPKKESVTVGVYFIVIKIKDEKKVVKAFITK